MKTTHMNQFLIHNCCVINAGGFFLSLTPIMQLKAKNEFMWHPSKVFIFYFLLRNWRKYEPKWSKFHAHGSVTYVLLISCSNSSPSPLMWWWLEKEVIQLTSLQSLLRSIKIIAHLDMLDKVLLSALCNVCQRLLS